MNANVEKRIKEIEDHADNCACQSCEYLLYVIALVKAQREALEKITFYRGFNGDTWAADAATDALAFDPDAEGK